MEELMLEHMGKGFITMLMISMPCVLVAAGVGLVIGILQAVTQVQEQTIAAAPKIFAVFLILMIGGGTFTNMLSNYFIESSHIAFQVITKDDEFALNPHEHLTPEQGPEHRVQKDKIEDIMRQPPKDGHNKEKDKIQNVLTPGQAIVRPNFAENDFLIKKGRK